MGSAGGPLSGRSQRKMTNVIPLKISARHVRTLMDSAGSDRPQRRTAPVGRKFCRYGIEVAALSETHFAKEREIKEVVAGFTFLWRGRKSEERKAYMNKE